jgi:hypothetical protein
MITVWPCTSIRRNNIGLRARGSFQCLVGHVVGEDIFVSLKHGGEDFFVSLVGAWITRSRQGTCYYNG